MENTTVRQSGGGMMKGILIGSALGAVAAMLLTPKTGKEMRETIRRKSSDISTAARDRAVALAGQAKERAGEVSVRMNEFGKAAADKMASAAEHTAQVIHSIKRPDEGVRANGASTQTGANGHAQDRP